MTQYLSLKDHVYNYIVEQMNNGSLIAGSKINENALSERLNVSRTPVREALIQLSSEGLLENVARKGFLIKEFKADEARETYYIIGALDGLAASLAIPSLTEKHMKEMDFYIQSMDLAINTENFSMYLKMQESFHAVYQSVCPNKSLVELLVQLQKKFLKNYDHANHEVLKRSLLKTNDEHRKMLELFAQKDGAALEKYMKDVHWSTAKIDEIPL